MAENDPLTIPDAAPLLSAEVLARCSALPLKPAPITLTGTYVELVPFDMERHAAPLFAVSNGSPARLGDREIGAYDAERLIWRYLWGGPFANLEEFIAFCRIWSDASNFLHLCVLDVPTGEPVGSASFVNNSPSDLKIELGNLWYSPLVQRTAANTETTYLMLKHTFGLGYRRVEWKCDTLNERSRRAALRMGFKFEGIQEHHFIIKDRNRDTAWYRILDHEWPRVEAHLRKLLYEPNL